MDWRICLGFLGIILCTILANLLLKAGAMVPVADRAVLGLLGWQSVLGLGLFGLGGLAYAFLLRTVPLNVAQIFTATQPLGVIMAAALVLGEPISGLRWIGILCTVFGVPVVGATVSG